MRARHRVWLTVGIAGAALTVIVWGWTRTPPTPRANSNRHAESLPPPNASEKVSQETVGPIVESLSRSLTAQLEESHPELPGVAGLANDLKAVYGSWMLADLDPFGELMAGKGATTGEKAEAIVNTRRAAYPDIAQVEWDTMPTEERLRLAWERPDERLAGWRRVATDRVRTGVGWHGGDEDLAKSTAGRYSIYEFAERRGVFAQAMHGERPTVWMVVPVQFNDGIWLETRLTWVWLDDARGWYPARVETLGPDCRSCLMF